LTFDDGPWADTPAVLDLLAQYHIKATFCMIGRQVATHAALVRRIVAEGHTLCNHTWSHDEMLRSRPADRIRAELQRTNDAIHAVVPGAVISYFRAPGGNFSSQVVSIAAGMGMTSIFWSVDPQDWRGPGVQSIITNVLINTRPGSIVLLHDGAGPQTVTALRTILPDLARRYTLIALSDADPRGEA
jgi:peptidoglycan/xylan/chitin deacetylase (PgdA/CDA1 family)